MHFWIDFDLDDDEEHPPAHVLDEARRVLTRDHPEIKSFRVSNEHVHVVNGRRVYTVEVTGEPYDVTH